MNTHPTEEFVREPRQGDALSRPIAADRDDDGAYQQACLDGRARRRLGASLLLANHLVWICLLASWLVGVRGVPRSVVALLGAAGPRAITSIELFNYGTIRRYAPSVWVLAIIHLTGIWMLTTVVRDERMPRLRKLGRYLRCAQLAGVALAAWAITALAEHDWRTLLSLYLLELPVALLVGVYLAHLGMVQRSDFMRVGGKVIAALLVLGSATFAGGAALGWRPQLSIQPWYYAGLVPAAAGGALLLALLLRLCMSLGREA